MLSSSAATMVSFDGRQQLTVDFEDAYDDDTASRTSEVDDVSLRMRTDLSSAHLLTSQSRRVTPDVLTIAINDGRVNVDIRTASDHKVRFLLLIERAWQLNSKRNVNLKSSPSDKAQGGADLRLLQIP